MASHVFGQSAIALMVVHPMNLCLEYRHTNPARTWSGLRRIASAVNLVFTATVLYRAVFSIVSYFIFQVGASARYT